MLIFTFAWLGKLAGGGQRGGDITGTNGTVFILVTFVQRE